MSDAKSNNSNNLPKGKYIMVSVDIDTTGRRLIDEVSFHSHILSK